MAAILTVRGEDGNLIPIPAIQGTPGIGISNITRTAGTGAPGTTDTYTITLEDGRTSEFTVYNGRNGVDGSGSGSGDMLAYIYDPTGKAQDIFEYAAGKAGDVSTQLEAHKSSATAHSDIREVANAAKSSADAAQTAAHTASATAQTAQTIANAAQAAAAGAMGFKRLLTSADDMDTLYEEGIYRADSGSLPANFPLTVSGIVEVINTATENKDAPTYGVEQRVTRYGASGTTFSRTKSGNAWHEWAKDYNSSNKPTPADLGAVSKSGDTMTGNLYIEKTWPSVFIKDTTTGRSDIIQGGSTNGDLSIYNQKDNNNRTRITLNTETAANGDLLTVSKTVSGSTTVYPVYHAGNKPTAAAIGAAGIAIGTYTGTGARTFTVTFSVAPKILVIAGTQGYRVFAYGSNASDLGSETSYTTMSATWNSTTSVTLGASSTSAETKYASRWENTSGTTYTYYIIY